MECAADGRRGEEEWGAILITELARPNGKRCPHTQIQIQVHIHKYKYKSTYTNTNTSPHTQIQIQIGAIVITERARPNVHTLHLRYSKYGKYITVIVMHDVNQHKMPTVMTESSENAIWQIQYETYVQLRRSKVVRNTKN